MCFLTTYTINLTPLSYDTQNNNIPNAAATCGTNTKLLIWKEQS
jgi:hypothetical protein